MMYHAWMLKVGDKFLHVHENTTHTGHHINIKMVDSMDEASTFYSCVHYGNRALKNALDDRYPTREYLPVTIKKTIVPGHLTLDSFGQVFKV